MSRLIPTRHSPSLLPLACNIYQISKQLSNHLNYSAYKLRSKSPLKPGHGHSKYSGTMLIAISLGIGGKSLIFAPRDWGRKKQHKISNSSRADERNLRNNPFFVSVVKEKISMHHFFSFLKLMHSYMLQFFSIIKCTHFSHELRTRLCVMF